MRFDGVCLSVKDIEASKNFYQDLLGLEIEHDWEENVGFKGVNFALQQYFERIIGIPEENITRRPNNMELVFEADDFDGFITKLRSYPNVELVRDVFVQPWGQKVVHIYDLDGHIIEVGEKYLHVLQRLIADGMSVEEIEKQYGVPVADIEKYLNGEW
ncbi:MAG: glyoxalase [Defluviitaleaceae bacterium]|nr:glyoxalase [Defluviitaleaceae bacterium]